MLKNLGQITFRDILPINKHAKTKKKKKEGLVVIYLDHGEFGGGQKELGVRQSAAVNGRPLRERRSFISFIFYSFASRKEKTGGARTIIYS